MFLRTQTVLGCFLANLTFLAIGKFEVAQGVQGLSLNLLWDTLSNSKVERGTTIESEQLLSCKQRRPNVDIDKIANGLQDCYEEDGSKFFALLGPEHFGGGNEQENLFSAQFWSISPTREQVDLVRRTVRSGCELAQKFWQCAKPILDYVREECGVNDDLELKSVRYVDVHLGAICKRGGNRLIDFYRIGGGWCVGRYEYLTRANECNAPGIRTNAEFIQTNNATNERMLPSFCELTTDLQTCLDNAVSVCPQPNPRIPLRSILEDVQDGWTKEFCLYGGATSALIGLKFSIFFVFACSNLVVLKFSIF